MGCTNSRCYLRIPGGISIQQRPCPEEREIPWYDGYLLETMTDSPDAYDDIYMDLAFVQVFEDEGLDAPVLSFANSFAEAEYSLWFANQVARYNVLNGLTPPESGHWLNNPLQTISIFRLKLTSPD